ncbi:MAG: translational GTPase TypA [Planctomycetota bacterium]|nr:MAG: translational GTPase TypA [Planctomycetota bacterium]
MNETQPEQTPPAERRRADIRNVAIVAHVDHGKTTLVDRLLQICGAFREGQQLESCVLDSESLERERGITILAKNTSVPWKGVTINLIDTPGHADFGGEVERTLHMADGCLLLVDAAEGPLPQTRFVLRKALAAGLVPVVVINKCDRRDARPAAVLDEIYDLFIDLDASEQQLEFPVLYGSGRQGWMAHSPEGPRESVAPLLDAVLEHIPGPLAERDAPLAMRVASLAHDDFVGRIALGRVVSGSIAEGDTVLLVKPDGARHERTVRGLFRFQRLGRERTARIEAGDIAAVVGMEGVEIGDSITCPQNPRPLEPITVEPPTLSMTFLASDSPFRGQEGERVTSRQLRERLVRELERNVALRVEDTDDPAAWKVSGRGLLHLGVLLETMRREGYELQVSKPEVILRRDEHGKLLEPMELLVIDVPETFSGKVIEAVGARRGELVRMHSAGDSARLEFRIPARGLLGLGVRLLSLSSGQAVVHHVFSGYGPWRGEIAGRNAGVMVAMQPGEATTYALASLQDRGTFFIAPGERVYEGMIVGEHCKPGDIVVNVTRRKQLTNIRAAGADEKLLLPPPRRFTIEQALEYIEPDELVEITPKSVRLRKRLRNEKERKRARGRKGGIGATVLEG